MGIAGHPDVKTPHLDTLADQGLYFKNAYSPCPSCIPARVELHTGLSPQTAGRVGYQDGIRWNYPHTLAGELTKAGYYTHMVGKMHVHPLRSLQGFHNVDLHDGYLGYYRNASKPYYENQLVADDYKSTLFFYCFYLFLYLLYLFCIYFYWMFLFKCFYCFIVFLFQLYRLLCLSKHFVNSVFKGAIQIKLLLL